MLGSFFLLAVVGSGLSVLILGLTACRDARQSQRWGWFSLFLSLTVLVGIGALTYFLGVSDGFFKTLDLAFLRILPLVAPPLALVAAAFVYQGEETYQDEEM